MARRQLLTQLFCGCGNVLQGFENQIKKVALDCYNGLLR